MTIVPAHLIRKTLTLSSAHIPKHTADVLEVDDMPYGTFYVNVSGAWEFPVDTDISKMTVLRLRGHGELVALLRLAEANGCTYLTLDGDEEVLDGLPTFDW